MTQPGQLGKTALTVVRKKTISDLGYIAAKYLKNRSIQKGESHSYEKLLSSPTAEDKFYDGIICFSYPVPGNTLKEFILTKLFNTRENLGLTYSSVNGPLYCIEDNELTAKPSSFLKKAKGEGKKDQHLDRYIIPTTLDGEQSAKGKSIPISTENKLLPNKLPENGIAKPNDEFSNSSPSENVGEKSKREEDNDNDGELIDNFPTYSDLIEDMHVLKLGSGTKGASCIVFNKNKSAKLPCLESFGVSGLKENKSNATQLNKKSQTRSVESVSQPSNQLLRTSSSSQLSCLPSSKYICSEESGYAIQCSKDRVQNIIQPFLQPRSSSLSSYVQKTRIDQFRHFSTFTTLRAVEKDEDKEQAKECKKQFQLPCISISEIVNLAGVKVPPKKGECIKYCLPCCSPARDPPECFFPYKKPPCQKMRAPRPAYSECKKEHEKGPKPCECAIPRLPSCDLLEKKAKACQK